MKAITFKSLMLCIISILLSSIIISCKKEKEADDPNITYRAINKTINGTSTFPSGVIDSIDFDGNGKFDFIFQIAKLNSDSMYVFYFGRNAAFNLDTTVYVYEYLVVNEANLTSTPLYIDGSSNYYPYGLIAAKTVSLLKGIAGKGDKIISFGFLGASSSDIHYGWMRMNLSADFNTFKIIDCGFSVAANTSIKLGAK